METPQCVLFNSATHGWSALLAIWLICFLSLLAQLGEENTQEFRASFFTLPRRRSALRSIVAPLAYGLASLSELSPIRMIARRIDYTWGQLLVEAYQIVWLCAAGFSLWQPSLVAEFAPFFLLWFWEYMTFAVRSFVMAVELQLDSAQRERSYTPEYRALFAAMIPYAAIIVTAAALYRANPAHIGKNSITEFDAIYISVMTIITHGANVKFQGCVRFVALWEVLAGLFVLVVIIAVALGRFTPLFSHDRP